MHFRACLLSMLVVASGVIQAKNTFVYDCLSHIQAPYNNDILTFLCDNQYHPIKLFESKDKHCSNNTQAFGGWSIRTIHFNDCHMNRIPYTIFATYYNLRSLNISSMQLNEMQQTLFTGASKLESVNVSDNRLKVMRTDQFALASNLTSVDLSFNNINTIETGAFDERSVLMKWLDMSHNQIAHIPLETFHKLLNLAYLNMSHNQLDVIEIGTFAIQKNLIVLDLSGNLFKVIDLRTILPHLGAIEVFAINGNPLQDVRGFMHQLFPRLMWSEYFSNSFRDFTTVGDTGDGDKSSMNAEKTSKIGIDAENATANATAAVEETSPSSSVFVDNNNNKSPVEGDAQQPNHGIRSTIFEVLPVITVLLVIALIIRQRQMEQASSRNELNSADCRYRVEDNECSPVHSDDTTLIA